MISKYGERKYWLEVILHCIFTDICESCGHHIATHEYTFQVDDGYQVRRYNILQ